MAPGSSLLRNRLTDLKAKVPSGFAQRERSLLAGAAESRVRFRWVKAPTSEELTRLTHTIAQRIARYLERQGFLVRDAQNSYLTYDGMDADPESPMDQLLGRSITYRIAVGPQQGRKVFTLQTLPDCRPDNMFVDTGQVAGFSLHVGIATRASFIGLSK